MQKVWADAFFCFDVDFVGAFKYFISTLEGEGGLTQYAVRGLHLRQNAYVLVQKYNLTGKGI